jgi:hypothetical protein
MLPPIVGVGPEFRRGDDPVAAARSYAASRPHTGVAPVPAGAAAGRRQAPRSSSRRRPQDDDATTGQNVDMEV